MEQEKISHKGLKALKFSATLCVILGVIAIIVQIFSDISHQMTTKLVFPQLFFIIGIILYLIFDILIKDKKRMLSDIVLLIFILLFLFF